MTNPLYPSLFPLRSHQSRRQNKPDIKIVSSQLLLNLTFAPFRQCHSDAIQGPKEEADLLPGGKYTASHAIDQDSQYCGKNCSVKILIFAFAAFKFHPGKPCTAQHQAHDDDKKRKTSISQQLNVHVVRLYGNAYSRYRFKITLQKQGLVSNPPPARDGFLGDQIRRFFPYARAIGGKFRKITRERYQLRYLSFKEVKVSRLT